MPNQIIFKKESNLLGEPYSALFDFEFLKYQGFFHTAFDVACGVLYALERNMLFSPRTSFRYGKWEDYFEPFWECADVNDLPIESMLNPNNNWIRFLTGRYTFQKDIPALDLYTSDKIDVLKKIYKIILYLKDDIRTEIEKYKHTLKLPTSYIAAHIRRGDRSHHKRDVKEYIAKILYYLVEIKNLFIATDDYQVIHEVQAYLDQINVKVEISTICPDFCRGSFEHFHERARGNARETTIALLADLIICSESEYFVGDFASGFAHTIHVLHKNFTNCFHFGYDEREKSFNPKYDDE